MRSGASRRTAGGAAAAGNEGGWQTARCLFLLNVLTGSVGTVGGTSPNGWDKFIPVPPKAVHPQGRWNELTWPIEYPLAHHEMSFLLPHFLKEGRGRVDTYFTRVYNPVWTNPDGFSWLEVLTDEDLVGCHVALTPTWSETAWFADYVLPMGVGTERHDVASYETHAGRWIGFRQPVLRVFAEQQGRPVERTYEANPGEVWEENEFWIDLSFRIDPDGELGIRQHFESLEHPGQPISVDEYYEHLFTHSIPGLPEKAGAEGLSPLAYMRKYGAYELPGDVYGVHEREVAPDALAGAVRTSGASTVCRALRGAITRSRTSADTCRSSATARWVWRSTAWCGSASRRRAASWSCGRRPCTTGGGPSSRSRRGSRAMSIGRTSTSTPANASWCRRSASRPSSTPARATPSGSTRSATATRCGCTRATPRHSASNPTASCG